jgi:hypothetical protein
MIQSEVISRAFATAALVISVCWAGPAGAASCGSLKSNLDDARSQLVRASKSSGAKEGTPYARRAASALSDASGSAKGCGCSRAASDLDDAEAKARRAARANDDEGETYFDELNRAIRYYNSALDALRNCRN